MDTKELYTFHRSTGKAASVALDAARADFAAGKSRYIKGGGWNPASDDGARWIESLESAGLRFVDYADKLARIDHTGWYADTSEGASGYILRGVVLQLPARDGKPRYLPAYADPNNGGAYRVDCSRGSIVTGADGEDDDAKRDAARAADSFAEHEAESEREYDDAFQRGGQWAMLKQEERDNRAELLKLAAEMRAAKAAGGTAGPTMCATLRGAIRDLAREIYSNRDKRRELTEVNGWWERKYAAVFNDGAGETVLPVGA